MQTAGDKRTFWQNHVTTWQESDLSQTAYCEQHGLKLSTFTYWRGKESRSERKFVPVTIASPTACVTVSLRGGVRIDLPAEQLQTVLPLVLRLAWKQD